MAIRVNSRPFAFRNFQGEEPTSEQLRSDLEQVYKYIQKSIDELQFSDIGGQITSDQAIFIDNEISSIVTGFNDLVAAQVIRIDELDAIVKDPRTGLTATRAMIRTEQVLRATSNSALARQISIVSAQVGTSSASITEERLARISADGTITASLTTEVAARISGDNTSLAAVTTEATARITADGNLSAKYTLTTTVSSGGVTVTTGMNITSAIGPGTNISSVVFQAADFKIWNSTPDVGVPMFDVSGSTIRLAGTLVVSTSGKVFVGTGTFGNTNTAFYVDDTGKFSLKDQLQWDGTTLSIIGNGTFSGNLSAAGGTFAGSLSAASGTFTGALSAATGSFSGTITAAAGTIGGFTLSSTSLSATNILADSSIPALRIGSSSNERTIMEIVSSRARFAAYNSSNLLTARMQGNDGVSDSGLLQILDSGGNVKGQISSGGFSADDGSTSTPSYNFLSDSNTGFRWNSSGDFRAVTNGSDRLVIRDSAIVILVPLKLDNAYTVGVGAATGYVTLQDSTGTTYKVPVLL